MPRSCVLHGPPRSSIAVHHPRAHTEPIILSWSGGKDSALALAALRAAQQYDVAALLTSVTTGDDRVSVHGVHRELLHAQARALGLPLHEMWLEPHGSNESYDAVFAAALTDVCAQHGARRVAFGDLFLEDVRRYREERLARLGIAGEFPLWGLDTRALARGCITAGVVARLVCVDTHALPAVFAGRIYDTDLLTDFPASVDPCGERGEFHTFVSAGPGFRDTIDYRVGEVVVRDDRFAYCELLPPSSTPTTRSS